MRQKERLVPRWVFRRRPGRGSRLEGMREAADRAWSSNAGIFFRTSVITMMVRAKYVEEQA